MILYLSWQFSSSHHYFFTQNWLVYFVEAECCRKTPSTLRHVSVKQEVLYGASRYVVHLVMLAIKCHWVPCCPTCQGPRRTAITQIWRACYFSKSVLLHCACELLRESITKQSNSAVIPFFAWPIITSNVGCCRQTCSPADSPLLAGSAILASTVDRSHALQMTETKTVPKKTVLVNKCRLANN